MSIVFFCNLKIVIRALLILLLLHSVVSIASQTRTALVIGNGGYKSEPLRNPVNDANLMASTLTRLGFKVERIINADRKTMRIAIRAFGRRLGHSEVGLFYYAGHGMQVKGKNYLIPVGADIAAEDEVIDEAVDASAVLRKMKTAENKLNIAIFDACRNNPFARSFRSSNRGLARIEGPSGALIAYATAPGSVAADGSGSNGIYTKHLVNAMLTPGVSIEQVFKRVRVKVREESHDQQTPWESSSLMDDFYFNPRTTGKVVDDEFVNPSGNGKNKAANVYIDVKPKNARIQIINIASKFRQGIALEPNQNYEIKISAQGYKPYRKWHKLEYGEQYVDVILEREEKPLVIYDYAR